MDSEHPRRVIASLAGRIRPTGRVITVANEQEGVGKSLIAFHLAVALAASGHKVLAIDLDPRQQTLSRALTLRSGTARRLKVQLAEPRDLLLRYNSGVMLMQEIARAGWDCNYVVIDAPGDDCRIARRAIAIADQLVSPVTANCIDRFVRPGPSESDLLDPDCFAAKVGGLRAARDEAGMPSLDWLVLLNRKCHEKRRRPDSEQQQQRAEIALGQFASTAGFRLGGGLFERATYRELLPLGLTQIDLEHVPQFARVNPLATREIRLLVEDLQRIQL